MKNFILTTSIALFSAASFAQTTKTNERNIYFSTKAGINVSNLNFKAIPYGFIHKTINTTIKTENKSVVGFNFTGYANYSLGNNFFIQPGISLQDKGGIEITTVTAKYNNVNSYFKSTTKYNIRAVEVPLNILYNIPTGNVEAFQISAGPYIAFNTSGKYKPIDDDANQKTEKRELKFGNKEKDDITSMDYGFNVGIGYQLASGFTVGANYGCGLRNMLSKAFKTKFSDLDVEAKIANRVFGFTIGYSF